MYRMIAFDMDGTLADTLPLCMEAFVEGVSPYVGHRLEEREVTRLYGLNEVGMIKALVGARLGARVAGLPGPIHPPAQPGDGAV